MKMFDNGLPLRTHWGVWEGIGEWRDFIRSQLHCHRRDHYDHPEIVKKCISGAGQSSHCYNVKKPPKGGSQEYPFEKVGIEVCGLRSLLKWSMQQMLSWSSFFPPHVIRCYLGVLHKGGSRCLSARYATQLLLSQPQERRGGQQDSTTATTKV